MSAILEIEGLTKRFGAMTAVDDVILSVEEGEIFGLLGPNGAGKSTTLKMLTTLLPPTTGTAQLDGFDLMRQASEVRRVIGYVPQALSADGSLTGYENLFEVLLVRTDLHRAQQLKRHSLSQRHRALLQPLRAATPARDHHHRA
jgi:ABC-2 type transport system ATP-binding protein